MNEMLDQAWDHIVARNEARIWSLATQGTDDWPTVRSVVLRSADRVAGTLEFHTDLRSPKVADVQANPRAAILCWLPEAALQIRMQVNVRVDAGVDVQSKWDMVPIHARKAYGIMPASGTPIAMDRAYVTPADRAQFAVLTCTALHIDLLSLGETHLRATYSRQSDWAGQWVAP